MKKPFFDTQVVKKQFCAWRMHTYFSIVLWKMLERKTLLLLVQRGRNHFEGAFFFSKLLGSHSQIPFDLNILSYQFYISYIILSCIGSSFFCFITTQVLLKVSKSQKHFSWNSIAQKTNKISDKKLPYEARAEFCQIIRSFLGGNGVLRKKCLEIYRPL